MRVPPGMRLRDPFEDATGSRHTWGAPVNICGVNAGLWHSLVKACAVKKVAARSLLTLRKAPIV